MRILRRGSLGLLAVLVTVGCAAQAPALRTSAGQRTVFTVTGGFTETMPLHTDEITDIGLAPLHNVTGRPVRVRSVSFAAPPARLRIVNVRAYDYRQTGEGITGMAGDLAKECPRTFLPHPVSSFSTPPHASTPWFIVIAFTISRPGRYYLGQVRVTYATGGRTGWQYQNINTTMIISNPPRPGPRPLPSAAVCG